MGRRRVHPAVWRLALVAVLFACWMGYLGYLVATRTLAPDGAPVVVSRAQIMASEYAVVAQVDSDKADAQVKVEKVLWQLNPNLPVRDGDLLTVTNLKDCQAFPRAKHDAEDVPPIPPPDFVGPGRYLLLLRRSDDGFYQVTRVPYSPGYPPGNVSREPGRPRIYLIPPGNTDVIDQFKAAGKPGP